MVNGVLIDLTPEEENQFNSYSGDTEEMKMERRIYEQVRVNRDLLLKDSDWTQYRDVTLENDTDWKTYRQALRDLPATASDPHNPTWPTKPS